MAHAFFSCGLLGRQGFAHRRFICKLDDGKQTRYLDIGGKFLDEKGELLPGILTDALYPSAKGYDIWYEAMHPLLEQMMQ